MLRPVKLALLALMLVACSREAASHSSSAQSTPSPQSSAPPFPTIGGTTREAVLASACTWAKDHFILPRRASVDTTVTYISTTGVLSDDRPAIAPLNMERGAAAALGFRDSFVAIDLPDQLAEARARGLNAPFEQLHLVGLSAGSPEGPAARRWCPEQDGRSHYWDFGRNLTACVQSSQVPTPPRGERLEAFTNVPVQVSDDILIAWSGYRWSGDGGALILIPTVDAPDGSWAINMGTVCPDIIVDVGGGRTLPPYRDAGAWIEALAPAPRNSVGTMR